MLDMLIELSKRTADSGGSDVIKVIFGAILIGGGIWGMKDIFKKK